MERKLNSEQIRKYALALDDAIKRQKMEEIVSYFSDDCEVELLGITLGGEEGLRKAIRWMYRYLKEIVLTPLTVTVDGNILFEEFLVKAKIKGGREIQVKQAEMLVYDEAYRVRSLHLYFDRLEFAEAFPLNFIEQITIKQLIKASLKGLR